MVGLMECVRRDITVEIDESECLPYSQLCFPLHKLVHHILNIFDLTKKIVKMGSIRKTHASSSVR